MIRFKEIGSTESKTFTSQQGYSKTEEDTSGILKMSNSSPKFSINEFYLTGLMRLQEDKFTTRRMSRSKDRISFELSTPKKPFNERIKEKISMIKKETKINNKFLNRLKGETKEYFSNKKSFHKVFDSIDNSFELQQEVLQGVMCYKPELGNVLESSMASLTNSCLAMCSLLRQEIFQIQEITEAKLRESLDNVNKAEKQRAILEETINKYDLLLHNRQAEINHCSEKIDSLNKENNFMAEWVHKKTQTTLAATDSRQSMIRLDHEGKSNYNNLYKNIANLKTDTESLTEVISQMEREQSTKSKLSTEFKGILSEMLKGEKHDQSTQISEHEMFWEFSSTAERQKGFNVNIGADNFLDMGICFKDKNNFRQLGDKADNLSRANMYTSIEEYRTNGEPIDSNDRSRLLDANIKEGVPSVHDKGRAFQLEFGLLKNYIWELPLSIKLFLNNTLEKKDTVKIRPWVVLKRDIGEFFHFAAINAQIQCGRVGLTTSMDEMLCMFFLEVVSC